MGASFSTPIWLAPQHSNPTYDSWGYIPESGVAPQHNWSQLYDDKFGMPDGGGIPQQTGIMNANPNLKTTKWAGQQNDVLATFGAPVSSLPPANNIWYTQWGTSVQKTDQYFNYPTTTASYNPKNDATVCTPENYPNCDMSTMRKFSTQLQPYNGWWAGVGAVPNLSPDGPGFTIPNSSGGAWVDTFQRWMDKIAINVNAYANNDYNGLDSVCDTDTSNYDPCDNPSALDKLIPLAMAGIGLGILRVYGSELLVALPQSTTGLIYVTVFITLDDVGKAIVALPSSIVSGRNPEQVKIYTEQAAKALTVGSGAAIGTYIANNNGGNTMLYLLAGGAIGGILQPIAYKLIRPGIASGTLGALIPLLIFDYVSRFWCQISNWGMNACDDFGENNGGTSKGFERARRWDAASIAAKLTDMACEEEGWSRDSEQAKFVYRGLLMNPLWSTAATLDDDSTLWDDPNVHINPLGLLVAQREQGQTFFEYNPDGWWQTWTVHTDSFTGTLAPGADPVTDQNRFACQNWDILFNADECSKSDATCAANNDEFYNRDVKFATNLKNWKRALVDASYDPNNIAKQNSIPGVIDTWGPGSVLSKPLNESPGENKLLPPNYGTLPFDPFTKMIPGESSQQYDCTFWATTAIKLLNSEGLVAAGNYVVNNTSFVYGLEHPEAKVCPKEDDLATLLAIFYFASYGNKDTACTELINAPFPAAVVCTALHVVQSNPPLVGTLSSTGVAALQQALSKCNLSVWNMPDKLSPAKIIYGSPDVPHYGHPLKWMGPSDPFEPGKHGFEPIENDCSFWAQQSLTLLTTQGLPSAYAYLSAQTAFLSLLRDPTKYTCDDNDFGTMLAIYLFGFYNNGDQAFGYILNTANNFSTGVKCAACVTINQNIQLINLLSADGVTALGNALAWCSQNS